MEKEPVQKTHELLNKSEGDVKQNENELTLAIPEGLKVATPSHLLNRLLLEVMRTCDKPTPPPGRTKIDMPLDIVISLLRPDELAKLQKYIASYLGKR
jgi:hypothetical protein